MDLTLKITCEGFTQVELDSILDLQGDLKELSESDEVKLRNSMIKYGFSFPIFYWEDQDGKRWSIDSWSRRSILKKMRDEGWTIPPLPADPIYAENRAEAKEKLLVLNSRYGRIVQKGFEEFINEPDFAIDEISDILALPEIGFSEEPKKAQKKPKHVKCPNCQHEFDV